jgi:spore germination protein KB
MFLMIGVITSFSANLSFIESIAKHDLWLTVLAGLGEAIIFVLIFTTLAKRFSGNSLIQINDIIYGSYIGKGISLLYLFYFLLLLVLNIRTVGDFFVTAIMPETPMVVFIIMIVFVCASAVRNGIEVISRCSFIVIVLAVIEILLTVILLIKDMKLTNFLPVFDLPLQEFIKASHMMAVIPFGETVVFLMIIAYVNKVKQVRKSAMLALIMGAIFLLLIVMRNTAVLGIAGPAQNYPSYQAVRVIDIRNIITRVGFLNIFAFIILMFLKISVFYYATVLGTAQLLRMRTYLPLIIPIGAIAIYGSITAYEYSHEIIDFVENIYPVLSLPFEVGIPLLSIVIAAIRGLPKQKEEIK